MPPLRACAWGCRDQLHGPWQEGRFLFARAGRARWPRVFARVRGSARSWRGAELRARRAAMPGERICPASERRGYTHHRDARGGSLRRWLDQGAQNREWKRLEISSRLYSLFRIVCDHVQSTWYTCSCGQIFNFFVEETYKQTTLSRPYTPVQNTGVVHVSRHRSEWQRATRTSSGGSTRTGRAPHTPCLSRPSPPLRARSWRTNTNTADRAPGAGRAHASSVL